MVTIVQTIVAGIESATTKEAWANLEPSNKNLKNYNSPRSTPIRMTHQGEKAEDGTLLVRNAKQGFVLKEVGVDPSTQKMKHLCTGIYRNLDTEPEPITGSGWVQAEFYLE